VDRFVPQAIRKESCLLLDKAGNASINIPKNTSTGTIIPRTAKTVPVSLPIAGIMVRPSEKRLKIPSINAAMANLLILGIGLPVVTEALESAELQELHT
jgi:hypothetical protein